jgi:epoxyqueuosine reductase
MENLRKEILYAGASLVGYADLRILDESVRQSLPFGITIGVALKQEIIRGIKNGPTVEYAKEYDDVNQLLNSIASMCAQILGEKGYQVVVLPSHAGHGKVSPSPNLSKPLPHKTVATLAGIGWIG